MNNHPDHLDLQEAIDGLQKAATMINEKKREAERFGTLLQLQTRIIGCPMVATFAFR